MAKKNKPHVHQVHYKTESGAEKLYKYDYGTHKAKTNKGLRNR